MRQPLLRSKVSAGVLALAGTLTPATVQGAPPSGTAIARVPRPILVLESYVGERPAAADAIMAPLLDELEARGFAGRPEAVQRLLGGSAPRPGALDSDRTAAEIIQAAENGYVAYTRGRFPEAEAALRLAIVQIHRNPALLVLDTRNLEVTFKILVVLALTQARRGDTTGSVATMIELIRTFRSQPIARADYGPDAERLYRAVWKQVQAMDRGQLAVTVENAQAVIFLDGQIRGLGKVALRDLVPGVYRVFVQVPATQGRRYEVAVAANQRTVLHVDWELDSALWLTDTWSGFVFATEAERARQAAFAGTLARRWSDGALLAVVGMVQLRGKPGVTATLYDAGGRVARSAVVALEGDDEPRLRALARFVADGAPGEGVIVLREGALPAARAPGPIGGWPLVPGMLVGAGAAAVVAGGLLYAIDQDPGNATPYLYRNTAPAGLAVGSIGVAALSAGLWLWSARGCASSPLLAIGDSGGFIGWAGEL